MASSAATPSPISHGGVTLFEGGVHAFPALMQRIAEAQRSIEIRAYIWRDDATGNAVAEALLSAADRGVQILIYKDQDASAHEYQEGNQQSFLHKSPKLGTRVQTRVLHSFYDGGFQAPRQRHSALAQILTTHPNVTLISGHRYDHAKVYVFDEARMMLGGMCIGDDAHHELVDFMVGLDDPELVARYRARLTGATYAKHRAVDFLLHSDATHGKACAMKADRLALLYSARRRLQVEMAFFGDPAFTEALVAAARRGVHTTLIGSRQAGKLRWYNLRLFEVIRRRAGYPAHLQIALHPEVVHSKVVVVDESTVDMGSGNFTTLSNGIYDEVNVCLRAPALARHMSARLDAHLARCHVPTRLRVGPLKAGLERHFMERHGRRTGR